MAGYKLKVYTDEPAEKKKRKRPAVLPQPELPAEPKRIRVQFDCRCCECNIKIYRFTYALWLGGGRVCCEDCPGEVTGVEELLGPDFDADGY
jgi:hypothetical protein